MKPKPGRYGFDRWWRKIWTGSAYRKTLVGLRPDRSTVALERDALRFGDYPFEPATVFPNGTVTADQIAEVNLGDPSTVRLKGGDILFVSRSDKEALVRFINRRDVTVGYRRSIWSSLLDPFLDTWEEQKTIDAQFAWFATLGLDRATVNRWRREVAPAMVAYNFGTGLWEWGILTLYDVMRAQHARLPRRAFADFYSRALQLAQRDPVMSDWGLSPQTVSGALFSVLLDWYPREEGSSRNFAARDRERGERLRAVEQRLTAELTAAYSEAHRRYHTLAHVEHCLAHLRGLWSYAISLNELRWAILFHDAIYDTRRQDNEARSADWACKVMDELRRPEDQKARIRAMILATAHSGEPQTADEALLLDIDRSILGSDAATFDEYDRSIRMEYDWVPETGYREVRARVLESFLNRAPLYRTVPFRHRYEASARKNLERALTKTRARGA